MMLFSKPVTAFVLSCLILSCSPRVELNDNTSNSEVTEEQNSAESTVLPIIIEDSPQDHSSDPFTVSSVEVEGDILKIAVSYGGGCKEHSWKMYSTDRVAKSYPPKLDIYLEHTANQDLCKALLHEELKFDLTAIQYKGSDIIHLQMNNYDDFIVYKY